MLDIVGKRFLGYLVTLAALLGAATIQALTRLS